METVSDNISYMYLPNIVIGIMSCSFLHMLGQYGYAKYAFHHNQECIM